MRSLYVPGDLQSGDIIFAAMKLIPIVAIVSALLLSSLAFSSDAREVTPEEATKHLQKKVDPVYPNEPNVRIRGDVVLQLEISESGAVTAIKAVSGHPMLIAPALDAVRKWHYSPFLLNGKPSAVKTTITILYWPPYLREEAIEENNRSELFYKTMDLCRKQISSQNLNDAEITCKKTIALSADLNQTQQLERMEAAGAMGHALFLQRKFPEALEYYQDELRIGEKTLKPYEAELAAAQYHVGNGLLGTGRTEDARVQYEKAESTYKQAAAHIESAFLKNEYAKKLKQVLRDHSAMLRQMGHSADADALDKDAATIVVIEGMRDQ
jgi:TonB family protein